MSNKYFLFFFVSLFCIAPALAAPPFVTSSATPDSNLIILYPLYSSFKVDETIKLHFHVYNKTGFLQNNASIVCQYHRYSKNGSHFMKNTSLTFDGVEWENVIPASANNETGTFVYLTWCNDSTRAGFIESSFTITNDGQEKSLTSTTLASVFTLLPMFFMLLLLISTMMMGPDHTILKFTSFLLVPVTFFVSLHFGLISLIRFYDVPALAELVGTTTYWIAWVLGVFITYVLIYFFYKVVKTIGEEKQEKMEY